MAAVREWIVVGAGPSAGLWATGLLLECPEATTIAGNGGIRFAEKPDYFFVYDMHACREYHDASRELQCRGTKMVTLKRKQDAMRNRGVDHYDAFIETVRHRKATEFVSGEYSPMNYTGLYCLQFAVNNGAERVLATGLDGYKQHAENYADRDKPQIGGNCQKRTRYIEQCTQAIVTACPDVEFVFYGPLRYELTGANVKVVEGIKCESRC